MSAAAALRWSSAPMLSRSPRPPAPAAFYGNAATAAAAPSSSPPTTRGSSRATTRPTSRRSPPTAATSRSRPAPRNFFADDDPDPPGQFRAGGIFRFDLQTQALAKVADGNLFDEERPTTVRSAAARSTPRSAPTAATSPSPPPQPLVAADTNDNSTSTCATWTCRSAIPAPSTSSPRATAATCRPPTAPPAFPLPGSEPGADVTRGVAISADGQQGRLPHRSALRPAGERQRRRRRPARSSSATAPRHDDPGHRQTRLRDRRDDPEPAGGAVGAALSADGTHGRLDRQNAAPQTRFLGGENTDPGFLYYLWRRVADGPARRPGGSPALADPDDPAAVRRRPSFDQITTGPCYGPAHRSGGDPGRHHLAAAGAQRRRLHGRLPDRRRCPAAASAPAPGSTSSSPT